MQPKYRNYGKYFRKDTLCRGYDLKKVIFEGMWPLPFGVSYNSYLVMDEKVALVDTVEADFAAGISWKISAGNSETGRWTISL